MTHDEATEYLKAAVQESFQDAKGQTQQVCLGIECALLCLQDKGFALDELELEFFKDGMRVRDARFLSEVPGDYQITGVWAVIYSCLMPRFSPFGKDPMRIVSLEVGYGLAPRLTFDIDHDNGLPMALDRPYAPEIFKHEAQARLPNQS